MDNGTDTNAGQTTEGAADAGSVTQGEPVKERETPAFKALTSQISEYKKQLAGYERERSAAAAAQKADEERKAIAAQEFEQLLTARNAEIETLKKELAGREHAMKRGDAERALLSAGVSDEIMRRGLLVGWSDAQPEDLNAWVAELRTAHPGAFAPVKTPINTGPAGAVATGTDNNVEARMKSGNEAIRRAAFAEKLAGAIHR
jgi:hypothetical protein